MPKKCLLLKKNVNIICTNNKIDNEQLSKTKLPPVYFVYFFDLHLEYNPHIINFLVHTRSVNQKGKRGKKKYFTITCYILCNSNS